MINEKLVRIDLTGYSKPEKDIVWMKMVLEYGHRNITVNNNGSVYDVSLPISPRLGDIQKLVETVIIPKLHCGA